MRKLLTFLTALLLVAIAVPAFAATTATITAGDWPLYRGTSIVSRHASEAACIDAAKALGVARAYTCRTSTAVVVAVTPDACTTSQPATESQSVACPAGTTGSWSQTRAYGAAPFPSCWTAGEWLPATAPAGACVALPPPSGVTVTASANPATVAAGAASVLTWSSANATACTLSNGAQSAPVGTAGTMSTGPLSAAVTLTLTCAGPAGSASAAVAIAIDTAPPPPPPPTISATITWSPPTANTDGSAIAGPLSFAIEQSPSWGRVATVSGTTYAAQSIPAGTCWRVVAISGEGQSDPSAEVCKG